METSCVSSRTRRGVWRVWCHGATPDVQLVPSSRISRRFKRRSLNSGHEAEHFQQPKGTRHEHCDIFVSASLSPESKDDLQENPDSLDKLSGRLVLNFSIF